MRTVDEHLSAILGRLTTLPALDFALLEAAGAVLAEEVRAPVPLPPFDNSAMDGFAVRFADVADASEASPVVLRVVADLPAGTDLDPDLRSGEAARIMTGAPLPASADTVVPFEATAGGIADSLVSVRVLEAPRRIGAHIRRRGEDCTAGAELVATGVELGPLLIALSCFTIYLTLRSRASFNILRAAYPDTQFRWREVWGAYFAGYGFNSVIPARGGDVIRLFLTRRSVPGSSYPAVGATFVVELGFDAAMGSLILIFAT